MLLLLLLGGGVGSWLTKAGAMPMAGGVGPARANTDVAGAMPAAGGVGPARASRDAAAAPGSIREPRLTTPLPGRVLTTDLPSESLEAYPLDPALHVGPEEFPRPIPLRLPERPRSLLGTMLATWPAVYYEANPVTSWMEVPLPPLLHP